MMIGAIDQVIPLQEYALRLNPKDQYRWQAYFRIGQMHLLQSRTDHAIAWLEKARNESPGMPALYANVAAAYALNGRIDRASEALAEAQRLGQDGRYVSLKCLRQAMRNLPGHLRELYETTFFTGLRMAGMPEGD